mmetsp:Transcript_45493/g.73004  ORF Transcript_45493/g.73004 Transcript_45493/m.73004 type:complete len:242 (-) Transcript_45493:1373-2098(-)
MPRFPEKRCLGILVMMVRSASPILARLFILRCALSDIFCARIRSSSFLSPAPGDLSARSVRLATLTLRLLLLCFFFSSSPSPPSPSSISASASPASDRARFRPSRTWLRSRARAMARLGSMPMAPRLSFMRAVVVRRSASAVRGIVGVLFPADFFRRCSFTKFARRLRTSCSISFSPSSISSSASMPASARSALHFSSSSSSSRSSSARRSSISGSMKSAIFLPLKISGTMSYFQSSSSSM